jgi:hypothetical protein
LKIEKKVLSFQAGNNYQKKKFKKFFILFCFILFFHIRANTSAFAQTHSSVRADASASAWTRFLPHRRTVKTRPWGKRGRERTSGQKGRADGNFPPKSSFMTSLGGGVGNLAEIVASTPPVVGARPRVGSRPWRSGPWPCGLGARQRAGLFGHGEGCGASASGQALVRTFFFFFFFFLFF